MRVRFAKTVGAWFDYLFVSPKEMEAILSGTDWRVGKFIGAEETNYVAVIRKKRTQHANNLTAEISCVAAVRVKPKVRLCEPWVMVR
jgi:hypothetical protein